MKAAVVWENLYGGFPSPSKLHPLFIKYRHRSDLSRASYIVTKKASVSLYPKIGNKGFSMF